MDFTSFLRQASTVAGLIDLLFLYLTSMSTFFVVGIAAFIVYFIIRYRRRSDEDQPPQQTGSTRLEVTWAAVLLGLGLFSVTWASIIYLDIVQEPEGARDVYVVGKMWMWEFQHLDGQIELNELHVPAGEPIRLTLISQDVIHSFYVPAFRLKQDALPQRYTTMWFEATQPGVYQIFCAEFCGTGHAAMIGQVIVLSPADFQEWLQGDEGALTPAEAGAQLFQQLGCNTCHRPDSALRAPSLAGIFGEPVELASGETVIADADYIRRSILDPHAQIVAGYEPIMPSYAGQISELQLLQLVAYIQSLEGEASPDTATTPEAGGGAGRLDAALAASVSTHP